MNDQIKDFVEQHREEFDHLEAPTFNLERFKRIQAQPVKQKGKIISLFNNRKWLVAASFVAVVATAWLFFYAQKQTAVTPLPNATATRLQPKPVKNRNNSLLPDEEKTITNETAANVKVNAPEKTKKQAVKLDEYKALQDSSSASTRLLAILEIEKTNHVNKKTMDMLSQTLNHDGNTNVRLAALGVLQKYSGGKYASSLLINSLNKQDDPIVQLGLVSFLGKMKSPEIGDKLYVLANNPETFAAVRDEAYSILLNQDRL